VSGSGTEPASSQKLVAKVKNMYIVEILMRIKQECVRSEKNSRKESLLHDELNWGSSMTSVADAKQILSGDFEGFCDKCIPMRKFPNSIFEIDGIVRDDGEISGMSFREFSKSDQAAF
jgi:hypothetical protein